MATSLGGRGEEGRLFQGEIRRVGNRQRLDGTRGCVEWGDGGKGMGREVEKQYPPYRGRG